MSTVKILVIFFAIFSLTIGVSFDCIFYESLWKNFGSPYACLATLTSSGGNFFLTQVNGDHLEQNENADVEVLGVVDSTLLRQIPRDIDKFFNNLIIMHWETKSLEFINANDLKPFPNLKVFAVFESKLVTIDGDLFQHTPHIQLIFFTYNRIEHVGHDLLTGLDKLSEVYFESNPCISASAQTKESIDELNAQLPLSCPPKPSGPAKCDAGCLELIESLQRTVAENSERLTKLEKLLEVLN